MSESELIEKLSEAEHRSWSYWMTYLFSTCEIQEDGSAVIPAPLVERWHRQLATPYSELTEREKQSDRDEVIKILPIIKASDHYPFALCCVPFCHEETVFRTFFADGTGRHYDAPICDHHFQRLPDAIKQRTPVCLLTIALQDALLEEAHSIVERQATQNTADGGR
jgi:hypothetical protein